MFGDQKLTTTLYNTPMSGDQKLTASLHTTHLSGEHKLTLTPRSTHMSDDHGFANSHDDRSENLDQVSVKALKLITEEQDTCIEERTSMLVPVFQTKANVYSLQVDMKLYSHELTFKSSFTSRNEAQILLQRADFLGILCSQGISTASLPLCSVGQYCVKDITEKTFRIRSDIRSVSTLLIQGADDCAVRYKPQNESQDAVDNPRLNNGPQEKQRTLRQTTICQEKKESPTMSSMWCCGSWISLWCEHMRSLQGFLPSQPALLQAVCL
ncbi:hypothetical protein RRG08_039633 [Elysia crispata]|uniref:Uncharacterized protein n=1 Tax=Elysia crispata TaxID=231223 RepID=A0AAE0YA74_9GAST|nr:hypothetical protein RRG08_039633 [Elysia crispata]